MARKLTDDEIMDYTYNKIFGDLDGIRSGSMFNSDEAQTESPSNAGTIEGINITVKPLMAGAAEGGKPPEGGEPEPEDEDRLKGIGKMSPLMERLHGNR